MRVVAFVAGVALMTGRVAGVTVVAGVDFVRIGAGIVLTVVTVDSVRPPVCSASHRFSFLGLPSASTVYPRRVFRPRVPSAACMPECRELGTHRPEGLHASGGPGGR